MSLIDGFCSEVRTLHVTQLRRIREREGKRTNIDSILFVLEPGTVPANHHSSSMPHGLEYRSCSLWTRKLSIGNGYLDIHTHMRACMPSDISSYSLHKSGLAVKMAWFHLALRFRCRGMLLQQKALHTMDNQYHHHHLNQLATVSGSAVCPSIWLWGSNYGVIDGMLAVLDPWSLQICAGCNLSEWPVPLLLWKQRHRYRTWLASAAMLI